MNTAWIYPYIILGGVLQTCGTAMNAQFFNSFGNKWLARMPWWAPLGGLFVGLTVTAALGPVLMICGVALIAKH